MLDAIFVKKFTKITNTNTKAKLMLTVVTIHTIHDNNDVIHNYDSNNVGSDNNETIRLMVGNLLKRKHLSQWYQSITLGTN